MTPAMSAPSCADVPSVPTRSGMAIGTGAARIAAEPAAPANRPRRPNPDSSAGAASNELRLLLGSRIGRMVIWQYTLLLTCDLPTPRAGANGEQQHYAMWLPAGSVPRSLLPWGCCSLG